MCLHPQRRESVAIYTVRLGRAAGGVTGGVDSWRSTGCVQLMGLRAAGQYEARYSFPVAAVGYWGCDMLPPGNGGEFEYRR